MSRQKEGHMEPSVSTNNKRAFSVKECQGVIESQRRSSKEIITGQQESRRLLRGKVTANRVVESRSSLLSIGEFRFAAVKIHELFQKNVNAHRVKVEFFKNACQPAAFPNQGKYSENLANGGKK